MEKINMKTIAKDSETKKLVNVFKTVMDKEGIANILADKTITKGLEINSAVLKHFYGEEESSLITISCISFGLVHNMKEDFYIVKKILGYNYMMKLLQKSTRFISLIK